MANKGIIKWFNNAKGYGFILPENGEGDIFAHYSAINMDGYKTLKAGQQVTYDIEENEKGVHAINITPGELQAKDQPGADQESPS